LEGEVEPYEFEVTVQDYEERLFLVTENGKVIGEATDIQTVLTGASGHVIHEGQPVCVFEVVRVWQVYRPGEPPPLCTAREAVERGWGEAGDGVMT
jgi:hypothetical protein